MSDAFDVLVMDLGGVTCRWLPDRRLVALAELSGLPPATIDQLVFTSGFDDAGERGLFPDDAFAVELARLLGLPATDEGLARLRAAWVLAFEPDERVLALIARATVPTALFTNNGPLLEAGLEHELVAVGGVFDRLAFSWRLGTAKPDPAAFAACSTWLDAEPARVFFVDDSEANVAAARAAGWTAHRHTHALDLTAALDRAGILGPGTGPGRTTTPIVG